MNSLGNINWIAPRVGFTVLCLLAFTSGCSRLTLPDTQVAEQTVREVPEEAALTPTASKLYASEIGSARFERSAIRDQQGYVVESGVLRSDTQGEEGSLVVVRSPDGSITAIIDKPGTRGLLQVDPEGRSTFSADVPHDAMVSDTVKADPKDSTAPGLSSESTGSNAPKASGDIDVLLVYGNQIYNRVSDPIAFALAQIETVNAALRDSLITGTTLKLAAIMISHNNYLASSSGLTNWQNYLAPYRNLFKTDMNVALSSKSGSWMEGYIYGVAYSNGYTSVNAPLDLSTVLRHEVAHNAGAQHCGEASNYAQGYRVRPVGGVTESMTILCRDENRPWYSNPNKRDFYGVPMGNASTGDTARVWRENATRLASYNPELPGHRLMLVGQRTATVRVQLPRELMYAGVVVNDTHSVVPEGPRELTSVLDGDYTLLKLHIPHEVPGQNGYVYLRASRSISGCETRPMNYSRACQTGTVLSFNISYVDADNPSLQPGHYHGLLKLLVKDSGSTWEEPINVSVAVWK
jgi:hypothetical protein